MPTLEIRRGLRVDTEGRTLSGYASVFDRPSLPLTDGRGRRFTEFVERGAFADSIRAGGAWALWNHDAGEVLARHPDTLSLREDDIGLRFSFELPDTQRGNDIRELMSRGVLSGEMSFGFRVIEDKWTERSNGLVRNLRKVDLAEISVTPEAAYPQTNSAIRNRRGVAFLRRRLRLAQRAKV
ncbi:MAG: HK97 family phage prohead protease [Ilumatobacteraceae bacterium]|jgi:HK97 family phage prohead protease